MHVYSIYDSKVGAYSQPFFAVHDASAVRMFASATLDENSNLHIHGGDYTLFGIGFFDADSGVLQGFESFVNLGTALAVRSAMERQIHAAEEVE